MSLNSNILDPTGKYTAKVTEYGQLVVAPVAYSNSYFNTLAVNNTAYNFAVPNSGKRFVITDILIATNKDVGVNGGLIEIYESQGLTDTTITKTIYTTQMIKNTTQSITGLNLILTEGVWLNAKTDDNTAYLTIMGYYIPLD